MYKFIVATSTRALAACEKEKFCSLCNCGSKNDLFLRPNPEPHFIINFSFVFGTGFITTDMDPDPASTSDAFSELFQMLFLLIPFYSLNHCLLQDGA